MLKAKSSSWAGAFNDGNWRGSRSIMCAVLQPSFCDLELRMSPGYAQPLIATQINLVVSYPKVTKATHPLCARAAWSTESTSPQEKSYFAIA